MSTNSSSEFGKFWGNKKLHNEAARAFFASEDPRNPSGHEPDWERIVAGPPKADTAAKLEELESQGFVGLYERLPHQSVVVPADDDPRRATSAGVLLLMQTTVPALMVAGYSSIDAQQISADTTRDLADLMLGKLAVRSSAGVDE